MVDSHTTLEPLVKQSKSEAKTHARLVPRGRPVEHLRDDYRLLDPSHAYD
jgi:hypothetical protein